MKLYDICIWIDWVIWFREKKWSLPSEAQQAKQARVKKNLVKLLLIYSNFRSGIVLGKYLIWYYWLDRRNIIIQFEEKLSYYKTFFLWKKFKPSLTHWKFTLLFIKILQKIFFLILSILSGMRQKFSQKPASQDSSKSNNNRRKQIKRSLLFFLMWQIELKIWLS